MSLTMSTNAQTQVTKRSSWASRTGFILAAVGSAVGLGNMWRFSYVAAERGGAAFVLLYLLFVAFVGIPLMTSEMVVGRMAQESPVGALKRLGGPSWMPLGVLFVVSAVGILSYYSVVAGWTIRYMVDAMRGAIPVDTAGYFTAVGTGWQAVVALGAFLALTMLIVCRGVQRGLELTAVLLMPVLFILLAALAIWAWTLPGGGAGYLYYLKPQLEQLLDPFVISSAGGQAFFSLSLGMGALITYASYLRSSENLAVEAVTVSLADFSVAFVSGLIVFPIIFHFGIVDAIGLGGGLTDNTVGTLFIAVPAAVQGLGAFGDLIIALFFVMLFFAGLTSAISMLEVPVAAAIDSLKWSRAKAATVFGLVALALGIPSAFSLSFLNAMNKLIGDFFLVVGGLFTSLLIGYRILPQAKAELGRGLSSAVARDAWAVLLRYVIPPILIVVAIGALMGALQAIGALLQG